MSGDEIRTRASQEVAKRVDLARHRLGAPPPSSSIHPSQRTGTFFFSSQEIPGRIRLMRDHLTPECDAIIREADEILRHEFRLLGYTGLNFGPSINWHLDPVHGKTAPLEPWFKIPFLDFERVGDHKITWELNRHQHFLTLAKAWLLTGNDAYVSELVGQWYSWRKANPYPLGINWGSSLEVAFRSLSWLWVIRLLENCPILPSGFQSDVVESLAVGGRYIERYLSTYFSPNTHLLGEVMALFSIGTLCPQIEASERWKSYGWQVLLREAERQVRPDGVYFEQALYYHVYALDFFLHSRLLAAKNSIFIPQAFDSTIKKMLDVVRALSQAGTPEGFGDDDGGRLFNPRRNRKEHLSDPLSIGAVTFHDPELAASPELTEEAIWLFGDEAAELASQHKRPAPLASAAFVSGGLYVIADPDPVPQRMVIDAGPQGTGRSGHGHADALAVTLTVDGRPWLIDPGAYVYISDTPERNLFRGTGEHNTLRVDGEDQALADSPFSWTSIPTVKADSWIQGVSFDLFEGHHTGYQRLADPVLHTRFVFHVHGGPFLIRDVAQGRQVHRLEASWHFAPDLRLAETDGVVSVRPFSSAADNDTFLVVLQSEGEGWTSRIVSGFTSPAYGAKVPSPVLRSTANVQLPAEHATMLVPLVHDANSGVFARMNLDASHINRSAYLWERAGESHYMIFNQENGPWTIGPCTSDAQFLYCLVEGGRVAHLVFCSGTFARLWDETVVTHGRPLDRFEWIGKNGLRHIHSSDEACQVVHSALESAALR